MYLSKVRGADGLSRPRECLSKSVDLYTYIADSPFHHSGTAKLRNK